jgi:ribonuclease Z
MSTRELLALGTASQVPTRQRNHNGYFLRWDDEGFLFDPGEGTQRQMAFGDLPASAMHRIFITHFHGDHCLGLAGILQRLSLDRCAHPVTVHYPASGQVYFERLQDASIYHHAATIIPAPMEVAPRHALAHRRDRHLPVSTRTQLDHPVPTLGYRIEERDGRTFLPERLAAHGVRGPGHQDPGEQGFLPVGDRVVSLEDVSVPRAGAVFAFVMDTRPCAGATALAATPTCW